MCLNLYVAYWISIPAHSFSEKNKIISHFLWTGKKSRLERLARAIQYWSNCTVHFLYSFLTSRVKISCVQGNPLFTGGSKAFGMKSPNYSISYGITKKIAAEKKKPTQLNLFLHLNTCKLTFKKRNKHWVSLSLCQFEDLKTPCSLGQKLRNQK